MNPSRTTATMRHPKLRKFIAALTCAAIASPSFAGMDAMIQFTNLSPYKATVTFPERNSDCWHDLGANDGRMDSYFDYYRKGGVSDSGYAGYLQAYKDATGIQDLAMVPRQNMANTSATLAPAVVGAKVDTALFYGETSAALFEGCKLATSTRGFKVYLHGPDGSQLSSQHYIIQDPPDSQWTMSQMGGNGDIKRKTITLGSGGHGNPWEIALTSAMVAITLVTIGTAGAELIAMRAALLEAAELEAILIAGDEAAVSTTPLWRLMLTYAWDGNMVATSSATLADIAVARSGTIAARLLYASIANGVLGVIQHNVDGTPKALPAGSGASAYEGGIDFSTTTLMANGSLPDDRSICVYQTSTFGITECRLVGVNLTIMPNGSLVFVPMPGVGSGN